MGYFQYPEQIIKKRETVAVNAPIKIYVNEIESRITFKIKTGYYLELLTPKTMKLLRSTKSKITKNENGETVAHVEITEVILFHFIIFNNDYEQRLRVLYIFFPNKYLGHLLDITPKNIYIFRNL